MDYFQDVYFSNLNAVYNLGGFFSISKKHDWKQGKHKFDQCKFYFVTEGECLITIEDQTFLGKAGDWFFIPAMSEHSYCNLKNGTFKKYWMHFDIYPSVEFFSLISLPFVVKVNKNSNAEKLFKTFHRAEKSDKLADKLTIKSCLIGLLGEYIRLAKPEGINVLSRADERVSDLLRYVNENLDKELSNEILAEKYFAHPNHFIRAFRDKTGQTPAKYIKQKRLEMAKRLLEQTDLNIAEIIEKVGIKDVAHFSRAFKEYYNLPPLKHRQYFKSQQK